MKKILTIIAVWTVLAASAGAQASQRQKVIHMAALRIAEQIQVEPAEMDRFVKTYQDYKKEVSVIMSANPSSTDNSEDAVELKIMNDFDKSGKLLQLRKSYYGTFRSFLRPSQIQQMYNLEKKAVINAK